MKQKHKYYPKRPEKHCKLCGKGMWKYDEEMAERAGHPDTCCACIGRLEKWNDPNNR